MENVMLKARDNTKLAATYWQGSSSSIILLHQLNKDRHSYDDFAGKLNKQGYTVLSIDFRGFGDSDLDKDTFDINDFLSLVSDVKAAKRFLEEHKANTDKIFIIGASIGANTALNYAPIDTAVDGIVLLSPGLDYRGVKIEESAKVYQGAMLLVSSENDEYSVATAKKLDEIARSAEKRIELCKGSSHGTDMLRDSDLEKTIIDWIKEHQ